MKDILKKLGKTKALEMYKKMVGIRHFEERVRYLFLEGIMPGTIHQCDGQEATAVGVCSALNTDDVIGSTHRPHGHAIAKGLTFNEMMAELFGKTTGCCHGKGGSMHVGNISKGMFPAVAITAGNMPIVAGVGLSFKMRGEKRVAVSFFGDGSSNEGAFHEAINFAAMYSLPCVFVCENNQYGASTPVSMTVKAKSIASRGAAYGIKGVAADGNDVLAVYEAAEELMEKARGGGGPSLLELKTYRRCGHSRRDAKEYMDKEEMAYWMGRDPIDIYRNKLIEAGLLTEEAAIQIAKQIDEEIEAAVNYAMSSPEPDREEVFNFIYA